MVRRRFFGCVLPLGRHASTNGSKLIQCASDSIALSSFQEGQNARHHNPFKLEQALIGRKRERAGRSDQDGAPRLSPQWILQAVLAAALVFAVGILLLGLPGAAFLEVADRLGL